MRRLESTRDMLKPSTRVEMLSRKLGFYADALDDYDKVSALILNVPKPITVGDLHMPN